MGNNSISFTGNLPLDLSVITNLTGDLLFKLDDNGIIVEFLSNNIEDLYLPPQNFLGKSVLAVLPSESAAKIMDALEESKQFRNIIPFNYSLYINKIDKYYQAWIIPNKKDIYILYVVDVSEKVKFEESSIKSEAFFSSVWKNSTEAMRLLDAEGKIVEVNESYCKMVEMTREELLGNYYFVVYNVKNDEEYMLRIFRQRFADEKVINYEDTSIELKSGKTIHLRMHSSFIEIPVQTNNGKLSKKYLLSLINDITQNKEVEKTLKLKSMALESAANAILITDINGIISWVNNSFTRITGYTKEEVYGNTPRILKAPIQDSAIYKDIWDTILSGKVWKGQVINRRKDGSYYIDEQIITPVIDDKGNISNFISIRQDVTEKKEIENKLSIQASLFDKISDAIIAIDDNYKITAWNKAAQNIFGWNEKETIGEDIREVLKTDMSEAEFKKLLAEINLQGYCAYEAAYHRKNGTIVYTSGSISMTKTDDHLTGFVGIFRDISEKKAADDRLRRINTLIKTIVESSEECVVVYDEFYNILYSKDNCFKFENNNGNNKNQISGKEFFAYWKTKVNDVFASHNTQSSEISFLKEGKQAFFEYKLVPIFDDNQNVFAVVLFYRNVTNRKLIEQENIYNERLASLGRMAAYISHEMKTPLNSIQMNVDIINSGLELPANRRKSFEIIQKETHRLGILLKDILKFSQQGSIESKYLSIYELIETIRFLLKPILKEKQIQLINNVEQIEIKGIRQRLESAFLQMIENSIEAITAEGIIEIYSQKDEQLKKLNIFIKDNGCGIEDTSHIFDPFFSTKAEGTGIGLASVKNIMRKHKGAVELISGEPGNTTFNLKFNLE